MERNVLEVGPLWLSLAMGVLIAVSSMSTICTNTSSGRVLSVRMGVIMSPIYQKKDIGTAILRIIFFLLIVAALASIEMKPESIAEFEFPSGSYWRRRLE